MFQKTIQTSRNLQENERSLGWLLTSPANELNTSSMEETNRFVKSVWQKRNGLNVLQEIIMFFLRHWKHVLIVDLIRQ